MNTMHPISNLAHLKSFRSLKAQPKLVLPSFANSLPPLRCLVSTLRYTLHILLYLYIFLAFESAARSPFWSKGQEMGYWYAFWESEVAFR